MRIYIAAALVMCSSPSWAQSVYKCGNTYSQTPCAADAKEMSVKVSPPSSTPLPKPPPTATTPVAPTPVAQQAPPTVPTSTQKPELQIKADKCLAYYRPLLRDPAGAYYTDADLDGRTITIKLHATNGFGGYITRVSSCEFDKNDELDRDWTKIHAQRGGWAVK